MSYYLSPSSLIFHEYTDVSWFTDLTLNINRLHTSLLKLNAMGDVSLTALADSDAIKWDAGTSKYVNFVSGFSTTTTTV